MSRRRRIQRASGRAAGLEAPVPAPPPGSAIAVPSRPRLWLLAAFLLPNAGALFCGFVLDDLPLVVDNGRLHSLRSLPEIWRSGYWPDRSGVPTYRPLTQTVWALQWAAAGSHAWAYHAVNLLLGCLVLLLAYRLLQDLADRGTAFTAALLFALFPIHTEATTSVVGSAELLAGGFGLGALLCYRRGLRAWALPLYAASLLCKESGAAVAGVALALVILESPRPAPWRRLLVDAAAAGAVVAGALWARARFEAGPSFVPPIDNPMSLLDPARRVLSALWVQVLYVGKTLVPVTLSADYSYKQIPLVMDLADARAWAGLAAAAAAALLFRARPETRAGLTLYAVLFLPASNLLFPIGTMMGERLAYLPSLGLALLAAVWLGRRPWAPRALLAVAVLYAARTAVRNQDWRNAETFYTALVRASPRSAKAHYFHGTLLSSLEDDAGALADYDEAIRIFPAYSEAFHNRGNTLARLGRREEAMESYRQCLRFDPGHAGAAANLRTLEAGLPLSPPRRKL